MYVRRRTEVIVSMHKEHITNCIVLILHSMKLLQLRKRADILGKYYAQVKYYTTFIHNNGMKILFMIMECINLQRNFHEIKKSV